MQGESFTPLEMPFLSRLIRLAVIPEDVSLVFEDDVSLSSTFLIFLFPSILNDLEKITGNGLDKKMTTFLYII